MENSVHKDELTKARKTIRNRNIIIVFLVSMTYMATFVAYKNSNRERTIVSPSEVHETFWIDSNNASPNYLQDMSTYFVLLANNISPTNVEFQYKIFLAKVNPNQQGQLKLLLDKQAQRVKRNNLITMFYIKGYQIDADANKVVVTGQLDSLIGDKMISSQEKQYRIGYQLINGKLYVNEYGEVQSNNPWGDFINETK